MPSRGRCRTVATGNHSRCSTFSTVEGSEDCQSVRRGMACAQDSKSENHNGKNICRAMSRGPLQLVRCGSPVSEPRLNGDRDCCALRRVAAICRSLAIVAEIQLGRMTAAFAEMAIGLPSNSSLGYGHRFNDALVPNQCPRRKEVSPLIDRLLWMICVIRFAGTLS
jgi:hypothetical protein